jgi:hypothetical protein
MRDFRDLTAVVIRFCPALALAGCVPYALPPLTASAGGAHRFGARSGAHVEAGLSPFQLLPDQADRVFDARASGTLDRYDGVLDWGIGAGLGPVLHPAPPLRVLPEAVARWTTNGNAAGVRVTAETSKFVHGSDHGGGQASSFHGEAGIGLYLEMAREWDAGPDRWTVLAGITLRIPAAIGAVSVLGR